MGELALVTEVLPPVTVTERLRRRFLFVNYGDIVHYSDLVLDMGGNPDNKEHVRKMQSIVNGFRDALLQDHRRALDFVRKVGYRVIRPEDHHGKTVRQTKKTRRALRRAVCTTVYTDLNQLTPEQRQQNQADRETLSASTRALDVTHQRLRKNMEIQGAVQFIS